MSGINIQENTHKSRKLTLIMEWNQLTTIAEKIIRKNRREIRRKNHRKSQNNHQAREEERERERREK